jgi:general stress protein 26
MGTIMNIQGAEASKKIKELAEAAGTCLMITSLDKRPMSVRPMAIQKADIFGRIYFLSSKDSEKNIELQVSDEMHLTFSNDSKSEYLSLYGHAEVFRDQKQIDEMYSVFANTWFKGKEDPMISIIRFSPEAGHYWDTKHGKIIQLAGILYGAITGKETDDGLEGDLSLLNR